MEKLLQEQFAPIELALTDESSRHAGHAGARPEGETHFRLRLVSAAFAGLNRVARQRLVHGALRAEFDAGLHALSLELKAPDER
jgi:BolA family transcriptional regulator, general stress-responsive regulator